MRKGFRVGHKKYHNSCTAIQSSGILFGSVTNCYVNQGEDLIIVIPAFICCYFFHLSGDFPFGKLFIIMPESSFHPVLTDDDSAGLSWGYNRGGPEYHHLNIPYRKWISCPNRISPFVVYSTKNGVCLAGKRYSNGWTRPTTTDVILSPQIDRRSFRTTPVTTTRNFSFVDFLCVHSLVLVIIMTAGVGAHYHKTPARNWYFPVHNHVPHGLLLIK